MTLAFPGVNLKRCDYTAICKQLLLNHISTFTHFSKKQILLQKSDSTIRRQIISSCKCKSDRKGSKTDAKTLKEPQKNMGEDAF